MPETGRGRRIGLGVRWAMQHFYPHYVSESDLFANAVAQHLTPESTVLDAGCGSGEFFPHQWRTFVRHLIGCDVDWGLARNTLVASRALATMDRLPFNDAAFDVVFSRYVLEHLTTPEHVFGEVARVLKPGGVFVALTPNRWHYVTLASRLLSYRAHQAVARHVLGAKPEAMFPTAYRANDERTLKRLGEDAGLTLRQCIAYETMPNYLTMALPLFLAGVLYERAVNATGVLRPLRVSLIATFGKRRR